MSSLKNQAISGIKWTMAASIVQRIISFGTTVVLARILSPADFGLFALAFVMIDGFGIFKSLGFDSALVRRKDEDIEKACNTAFFLIPAMGMILFVILFFFAPIGAKFLNNPQVAPIIRTLALVFVISTFGKVPQTILYRSMKFKYKSIAEVSATVVYAAVALALALTGHGVWSLVIAYVLKTLTQISIEWHFSGWKPKLIRLERPSSSTQIYADPTQISADNPRPSACNPRLSAFRDLFSYRIKFEFDKTIAWDMFHFGKYILAGGIVWFLYSNLDNIVIGKLLGVAMLGFYAIAMNVSTFLSQYLLDRVGSIMYPAYSKIQEDPEDVKRVMLKVLKYVSIILFPFSFGLFIFAPDILRLVFGAKWLPATNILRILAFVGMFRGMGSVIWPIFAARGKAKADFQVNLAQVVIFFVLVVPLAIKFKLLGVGAAVLLANLISFVIGIVRTKRMIHVKFRQILASLGSAMIASIFMLCIAILAKFMFSAKIANENFIISGSASFLAYIAMTYLMNRKILKEIKEILV